MQKVRKMPPKRPINMDRKNFRLSEISSMSPEEIEELINSVPSDVESEPDDEETKDMEDSDDSVADPEDLHKSVEPISAEKGAETEQCVSRLRKTTSAGFLSKGTSSTEPTPSTSKQLGQVTVATEGQQGITTAPQVPTIASVRLKTKPQKRSRSPLPEFDPEGPQFEPNAGGFLGNIKDIDPKSNEFKNIVWRKKSIQLHHNEVAFRGDATLPEEITKLETPHQCFKFFFTDEFFESIANCTNLNARSENVNTTFSVTAAEIRQFVGIVIYMSLYRYPTAEHYWGEHAFTAIKSTMTSKRFFTIRRYLSFNDYSLYKKRGDPGYDPLFKVRPIIKHLNERFDLVPKMPRLCVDEQMCATKMQHRLRQFMPNKPHRWGMKLFVLCDSTGYSYRFELYSGANDNVVPDGYPDLGATSNVVLRLATTIPPMQNYILYFDNFYTSLPLLVLLRSRGIYSLGTIRRERIPNCKLPTDKDSKLKRGESVEFVGNAYGVDISTVQWKDTKNVRLASTYVGVLPFSSASSENTVGKAIRYDRKNKEYLEIHCPHIIKEYNCHMGGVDLMDGLLGRYRIRLKTKSYSLRLFYHFIDMALVNAYLLHRRIHGRTEELPNFRTSVANVLCKYEISTEKRSVGRPSKVVATQPKGGKKTTLPAPEVRFDQTSHWPKFLDRAGKRTCKLPGCKSDTQVVCTKCNLNLCFSNAKDCFVKFHNK